MGAYEEFVEAKEKVMKLTEAMTGVFNNMKMIMDSINDLYNRLNANNQSLIAQNVTIQAITKILEKRGQLTNEEFFLALKEINDGKDKNHIKAMAEAKIISTVDVVAESGLIVVKEDLIGEKSKNLTEYRVLDLDDNSPEFVASVVGKKVGEVIINKGKDAEGKDQELHSEIIEIYEKVKSQPTEAPVESVTSGYVSTPAEGEVVTGVATSTEAPACDSDCACHNEPAQEPAACDCGKCEGSCKASDPEEKKE